MSCSCHRISLAVFQVQVLVNEIARATQDVLKGDTLAVGTLGKELSALQRLVGASIQALRNAQVIARKGNGRELKSVLLDSALQLFPYKSHTSRTNLSFASV
jgi:hypothetical protein